MACTVSPLVLDDAGTSGYCVLDLSNTGTRRYTEINTGDTRREADSHHDFIYLAVYHFILHTSYLALISCPPIVPIGTKQPFQNSHIDSFTHSLPERCSLTFHDSRLTIRTAFHFPLPTFHFILQRVPFAFLLSAR